MEDKMMLDIYVKRCIDILYMDESRKIILDRSVTKGTEAMIWKLK